MTPANLIHCLAEEIRSAVEGIIFPRERGGNYELKEATADKISVFEQMIPADFFTNDYYYPAIVVELVDISDEEFSQATVALSFGVYAESSRNERGEPIVNDGWQDCFHLMHVVRQRLLTRRTIANQFRLNLPATWEIAPEQPSPFYFAYAELTYSIYQPQEKLEYSGYLNDN